LVPHYERYDITVKATGKPNQWEYSGKVEIVDSSTIRITELPPGMSIENMRKRLIEMEDAESIMDFADRSTENINISVKMKRGTVKDWTQEQAIDFFKLREKVTERIVVIDWAGKAIRTYDSAEQLVVDFAAWRLGWYTKRFQKLLADASYELNYWYALRSLFKHKFPALLGSFLNRKAMEDSVTDTIALDNLTLDSAQMDRVCNLATYRWTHEFEMEINKKIAELEANIAEYNAVLGSPERLKKVYLNELDKVAMFKG
jgi:DNA gyrase/topoisomerase IV subunit A